MPDGLKRFYVLILAKTAEVAEECVAFHREDAEAIGRSLASLIAGSDIFEPTAQKTAELAEHDAKHRQLDTLNAIFWHSVRLEVPGARDAEVVGLRKGWKVTISKHKRQEPVIGLTPLGFVRVPRGLAEALCGL